MNQKPHVLFLLPGVPASPPPSLSRARPLFHNNSKRSGSFGNGSGHAWTMGTLFFSLKLKIEKKKPGVKSGALACQFGAAPCRYLGEHRRNAAVESVRIWFPHLSGLQTGRGEERGALISFGSQQRRPNDPGSGFDPSSNLIFETRCNNPRFHLKRGFFVYIPSCCFQLWFGCVC